jgi:hypothetical protein
MCDNNLKNLIARVFKNEVLELDPGQHFFDETVTLHISGSVTKQSDQMVAPTASLPVIPVLALFWEKCGVSRDHALRMLREAITEAIQNGKNKDERIEARIKDVEKAIGTVRKSLAELPKTKRAGRVVTKDLQVTVLTKEASPAAA